MGKMLRRCRYSMADLASTLGERPETVAAKLRCRHPVPERDLCVWSWMTGTRRTHAPLAELVQLPDGEDANGVPKLGRLAPASSRADPNRRWCRPTHPAEQDGLLVTTT